MVSNLTGKINLNTRISNSNTDNSKKAKNIDFTPNVSKKSEDLLSKTQYEIKQMRGTVTNLKSMNTGTVNKNKHSYTIAMPKKSSHKENLLMRSINVNSKEFDREEILAKHSLVKGFDTIEVSSGVDEKRIVNHGKLIIYIYLYLSFFIYMFVLIYLLLVFISILYILIFFTCSSRKYLL